MFFAAAALALLLAACGQTNPSLAKQAPEPTQQAVYSGPNLCEAKARKIWVEGNGADYTVEAETFGPSCAEAIATLKVFGPEHVTLHTFSAPARQIFGLADAADPAAMQRELAAWLDQSPAGLRTTAGVPGWRAAALQPEQSEFPFYPAEGMTRDAYLAVRAARLPMFCFAQGRESMSCLYLENGEAKVLGIQSFPG